MWKWPAIDANRATAATGAVLLHALFGYLLINAFAIAMPVQISEGLKLFDVGLAPPPPPVAKVQPHRVPSKRREGAASPPNLRAKATAIVAPPPIVPLILPPPIIAAPVGAAGNAPFSGAADVRGPGTGAGGQGTGTGSGGRGDGDGGGGATQGPRWLKGRLKNSDYPRSAAEVGAGGAVFVRFTVETDGRVSRCIVTHSSGNRDLDDTTCRLIQERLRYEPARDASGRAVTADIVEEHEWIIDRP